MADYSIHINTKLDNSEFKRGVDSMAKDQNELTNAIDRTNEALDEMGKKSEDLSGEGAKVDFSDTEKSAQDASGAVDGLGKAIEKVTQSVDNATKAMENMTRVYQQTGQTKAQPAEDMAAYYKAQKQAAEDAAAVWRNALETSESARKTAALNLQQVDSWTDFLKARQAAEAAKKVSGESSKAERAISKIGQTARRALPALVSAFKKVSESVKSSNSSFAKFESKISGLIKKIIAFSLISKLLSVMTKNIKAAFAAMKEGNTSYARAVESLQAANNRLAASFASAFAPIVEAAIPYIIKLIDYINVAVNSVSQLIAALMGKATYSVGKLASSAQKAKSAAKDANKQLQSYDKLNNVTTNEGNGGDSGAAAGFDFDEKEIESKYKDLADKIKSILGDTLEKIKSGIKAMLGYLSTLGDSFSKGFWDALGDPSGRLATIRTGLEQIAQALKDIWTDPEVMAAADRWAKSVAYLLGSLAGSVASIGLTIGANLIGGLGKYLEENTERIKQYLISMFDIWEDVNYLLSTLFQDIAYIFEAFGDEAGVSLTANLIGIFADAFMGLTELASKAIRDVLDIIITPIHENREAFRQALDNLLAPLAEVAGTAKQIVDEVFAELNQMWDKYITPAADLLAKTLSSMTETLLKFWNETVSPVLDRIAKMVQKLWEYIRPVVMDLIGLVGEIVSVVVAAVAWIWESLKPLIDWLIENVFPFVVDGIDAVCSTIEFLVSIISAVVSTIIKLIRSVVQVVKIMFDIARGDMDALGEDIGILKDIWSNFGEVWGNVCQAAKDALWAFYSWGKNIWDTLGGWIDWIVEKLGALWDSLTSLPFDALSKVAGWGNGSGSSSGSVEVQPNSMSAYSRLSTTRIPALATGTIIPANASRFLAMLGDNNQETEVVSPLSTIEDALVNALQRVGFNGNNGGDVVVQIDGREIARAVRQQDNIFRRSTGSSMFNYSGA